MHVGGAQRRAAPISSPTVSPRTFNATSMAAMPIVELAPDQSGEQGFGLVLAQRHARIKEGQDVRGRLASRRRLGGEIGHVHGSDSCIFGQRKSPPVAAGLCGSRVD